MNDSRDPPVVLSIAGHDPSGGAGIQADIEAIGANACLAASVVTCLTAQNTCKFAGMVVQPPAQIRAQCRLLFADSPIAAVKIGLLGNAGVAREVAALLAAHPELPVVLDPILGSGSGRTLADAQLRTTLLERLLPVATLITPNGREARILAETAALPDCAARLLDHGCRGVLITGAHEAGDTVINRLYAQGEQGIPEAIGEWRWQRLHGEYHGSGCTLAAAIAALLARGMPLLPAVAAAQDYTWQTLRNAVPTGACQRIPRRLYANAAATARSRCLS